MAATRDGKAAAGATPQGAASAEAAAAAGADAGRDEPTLMDLVVGELGTGGQVTDTGEPEPAPEGDGAEGDGADGGDADGDHDEAGGEPGGDGDAGGGGEGDGGDPSDADDDAEGRGDRWPARARKRINRLARRRAEAVERAEAAEARVGELERQIQEGGGAVALAPTDDDPLADVRTEHKLQARLAAARDARHFLRAHPDGVEVRKSKDLEETVFLEPSEIRRRLDAVDDILNEHGLRRQESLRLQSRSDRETRAAYPALYKAGTQEAQGLATFVRQFPQITRLPNHRMIVGDAIAGIQSRLARAGARGAPGAGARPSPGKPNTNGRAADAAGGPAPLVPPGARMTPKVAAKAVAGNAAMSRFVASGGSEADPAKAIEATLWPDTNRRIKPYGSPDRARTSRRTGGSQRCDRHRRLQEHAAPHHDPEGEGAGQHPGRVAGRRLPVLRGGDGRHRRQRVREPQREPREAAKGNAWTPTWADRYGAAWLALEERVSLDMASMKGTQSLLESVATGEYEFCFANYFGAAPRVALPGTLRTLNRATMSRLPDLRGDTLESSVAAQLAAKTLAWGDRPPTRDLWGRRVATTPEGFNPWTYWLFDPTRPQRVPGGRGLRRDPRALRGHGRPGGRAVDPGRVADRGRAPGRADPRRRQVQRLPQGSGQRQAHGRRGACWPPLATGRRPSRPGRWTCAGPCRPGRMPGERLTWRAWPARGCTACRGSSTKNRNLISQSVSSRVWLGRYCAIRDP